MIPILLFDRSGVRVLQQGGDKGELFSGEGGVQRQPTPSVGDGW